MQLNIFVRRKEHKTTDEALAQLKHKSAQDLCLNAEVGSERLKVSVPSKSEAELRIIVMLRQDTDNFILK